MRCSLRLNNDLRPADYITFRAFYLAPLVQLVRINELEQEA